MYSKNKYTTAQGFTLIEIIASIALLVLVIGTLLPFFPQIMSWTQTADDELVASNLLSQVASDLKNNTDSIEPIANRSKINGCGPVIDPNLTYENINDKDYYVKITLCQDDLEFKLGLYRTHMKILNEKAQIVSESYTYLTNEGDPNANDKK